MKEKSKIDNAIAKIAFTLQDDYDLYLYVLTPEEEENEKNEIERARNYLASNNIAYDAVFKHHERLINIIPKPIRFIDRPHFKAVETEDLPF